MRFVITAKEFEFHEKIYIVETDNSSDALSAAQGDDVKPLTDIIVRRTVIEQSVIPLDRRLASALVVRQATDRESGV